MNGFVFLSFIKWRFITIQDICFFYQPSIHFSFLSKAQYPFLLLLWVSQWDYCSRYCTLHDQGITKPRQILFPRNLALEWKGTVQKPFGVDSFWGPKGTLHCLLPLGLLWTQFSAFSLIHNHQRTAKEPWYRSLTLNYVYFRYNFLCLECPLLPSLCFQILFSFRNIDIWATLDRSPFK